MRETAFLNFLEEWKSPIAYAIIYTQKEVL